MLSSRHPGQRGSSPLQKKDGETGLGNAFPDITPIPRRVLDLQQVICPFPVPVMSAEFADPGNDTSPLQGIQVVEMGPVQGAARVLLDAEIPSHPGDGFLYPDIPFPILLQVMIQDHETTEGPGSHASVRLSGPAPVFPSPVRVLGTAPPTTCEVEGLYGGIDPGLEAGPQTQYGVLTVGIVPGPLPLCHLTDLDVGRGNAGGNLPRSFLRTIHGGRDMYGNPVIPLPVLQLVIDQELGALGDPPLVFHGVEFLEEHGLEGDVVRFRQGGFQDPVEEILEHGIAGGRPRMKQGIENEFQVPLVVGRIVQENPDPLVDGGVHLCLVDARVGLCQTLPLGYARHPEEQDPCEDHSHQNLPAKRPSDCLTTILQNPGNMPGNSVNSRQESWLE